MALRDRLAALMGGEVPWVQAVLAVPLGFVDGDPRGACGGKVWVVHQEDLPDRLAGERVPARLDKAQVGRLVDVLSMLQANAAKVYRRPTTPAAAVTDDNRPRHTPT